MKHLSWCLALSLFAAQALRAGEAPLTLDLSCDRSTYSNQELSCTGHVQLQMPEFNLKGERLCWQETSALLSLDGSLARVEYLISNTPPCTLEAEHLTLSLDAAKHPVHLFAMRRVNCHYPLGDASANAHTLRAEGDCLHVQFTQEPKNYQVQLDSCAKEPCRIELLPSFQGQATSVQYATSSLHGRAQNIQGELALTLEKGPGRLTLKADHLTWDGAQHHAILEGHIELKFYQEGQPEPLCTLTATDRLTCACLLSPHLSCHKIQVEGPMQLLSATWGTLTCCGLTLMDCLKNKVIARGLQGSGGQVPPANQACLETAHGKIQADRLALDLYREGVRGYAFHAQGLVGIEGLQGQYALSHEMHYDARTREGQLFGTPSQRVLFWEPRYDVKLSAPACLFLFPDSNSGKIQIQGKGDVRMSFFDMERKKIQTRFPSYERHKT